MDWYRGQRKTLWVFSHTVLWHTPSLPPVEIRVVLMCDPVGKMRMEAFFYTDLQATPVQILAWAVMSWSVQVTLRGLKAIVSSGLECLKRRGNFHPRTEQGPSQSPQRP